VTSRPVSVIVTTYRWPQALDVVLRALAAQRDQSFEVIVAEDDSGQETADVVTRWKGVFRDRLRHVRQPDRGWRLSRIRNLGALHAAGRYLVFLDGDCIARRGFMEAVRRAALPGWFLASKRLHLSEQLTARVLEEGLPVWRWSALGWLLRAPGALVTTHRETGTPGVIMPVRDRRRPWRHTQPEFSPPYNAYGFFLGVSRADFEAVDGFDMRFVSWGGEDRDVAERLRGRGLRCGWPGPSASMLHLWHPPRRTMPPNEASSGGPVNGLEVAAQGLRELATEVEMPLAERTWGADP
jgi:glycosyltransferase involved in cell wall biosynthesis